MHDQDDGVAGQERDRGEVCEWIVAHGHAHVRRDHNGGFRRHQQAVAVRIGLGRDGGSNPSGGTRAVLHHEGLTDKRLKMRREKTRNQVGPAPGQKRHDDPHRPVGIGGLRRADLLQQRRAQDAAEERAATFSSGVSRRH